MKKLALQHSDLSQANRATILNFIKTHHQISRADLVKKTKMAGPTVSRIVQGLINEGLVSEGGVGESLGGRRPIQLTFRPEGRVVVGLDIRPQLIHGIICNLNGDILVEEDMMLTLDMTMEEIVEKLIGHTEALFRRSKVNKRDLAGIGISIPGLVDHHTQTVRFSPPTGWRNLPIRQPLSEHFGVPVMLGNTVEVMTLAEKHMGSEISQSTNNLAYLYFGAGVGAGLINNGTLFRGSRYSGVEFGHTTIDLHGPMCRCGNQGCMEAIASEKVLLRKTNEQLRQAGQPEVHSVEEIAALSEASMKLLLPVFAELATCMGVGIANMINLFNPDVIVIGGWPSALAEHVLEQTRSCALKRSLEGMSEGVQMIPSNMGERSVVLGAASLIIEKFFKGELTAIIRERV